MHGTGWKLKDFLFFLSFKDWAGGRKAGVGGDFSKYGPGWHLEWASLC